jgi:hypothetical protein
MATQNLLQRLDVAEDTTGSSADASNRRIEEVFICAESTGISSGDAVALDMSQTSDSDKALKVVQATDNATDRLFVGVALEDAVDGANIRVCIRGFVEANVSGSTLAGSLLQVGSTAGQLAVRSLTTYDGKKICAVSTEADAANVATIYVYPQF